MSEEVLVWIDRLDGGKKYLQPWNVLSIDTAMVVPLGGTMPVPGVLVTFNNGMTAEGMGDAATTERELQRAIRGLSPSDP